MKKLTEMDACEIAFSEMRKQIDDLEQKLKKIETLADRALIKAQLSHSLVIVRKVGEDRLEELKNILD